MAEVDRRSFLRLLRRSEKDDDEARDESPPVPEDPEIRQLAELTTSLLSDVQSEEDEQLAEGQVLTGPYDRAYMRVTTGHIVFSIATGFSGIIKTSDVTALDTDPPIENDRGYGARVRGVLHAHHPADLPTVTRSYTFRFPADSPLITAVRTACNLPEPEPEPEEDQAQTEEADAGPADRQSNP